MEEKRSKVAGTALFVYWVIGKGEEKMKSSLAGLTLSVAEETRSTTLLLTLLLLQ